MSDKTGNIQFGPMITETFTGLEGRRGGIIAQLRDSPAAEPVKERDVRELINELGLAVARMEKKPGGPFEFDFNTWSYIVGERRVTPEFIQCMSSIAEPFQRLSDAVAALDTRLEREFNAQADWCSETRKILQRIVKKRKKGKNRR